MTRHRQLLLKYVAELLAAKSCADIWWDQLISTSDTRSTGPGSHQANVAKRWPDGPASHPRVLAVVRKYWLACDALNQAIDSDSDDGEPSPDKIYTLETVEEATGKQFNDVDEENFVDPHIFVSEWLVDEYEDLAAFVGQLSYWPVGMDEQERYT